MVSQPNYPPITYCSNEIKKGKVKQIQENSIDVTTLFKSSNLPHHDHHSYVSSSFLCILIILIFDLQSPVIFDLQSPIIIIYNAPIFWDEPFFWNVAILSSVTVNILKIMIHGLVYSRVEFMTLMNHTITQNKYQSSLRLQGCGSDWPLPIWSMR